MVRFSGDLISFRHSFLFFYCKHFIGEANGGSFSSESCPSQARKEGKIFWCTASELLHVKNRLGER